MKLSVKAFGLTCGIILGLFMFLVTAVFILADLSGQTLVKLHNIFIGYDITWLGAIIGLAWGFVVGFIGGVIFSGIYNSLCKDTKAG